MYNPFVVNFEFIQSTTFRPSLDPLFVHVVYECFSKETLQLDMKSDEKKWTNRPNSGLGGPRDMAAIGKSIFQLPFITLRNNLLAYVHIF